MFLRPARLTQDAKVNSLSQGGTVGRSGTDRTTNRVANIESEGPAIPEGELLWTPSAAQVEDVLWHPVVRAALACARQAHYAGAEWFPGARLNYAEHVLRNERAGTDALLFISETTPLTGLPWEVLAGQVRILATRLRELGVRPGDRVVAYMPNIPQTMIAMLERKAASARFKPIVSMRTRTSPAPGSPTSSDSNRRTSSPPNS